MHTTLALPRDRSRRLDDMLRPDQNNFAIVRLIAAFAVLVSHGYLLQSGLKESEPLRAWTGYSLGSHGVQIFFVLSGILVAQSLMRSISMFDFATARALRIFPGLIVCVAAVALILGPILSPLGFVDYFRSTEVYAYLAKTLLLTTGSASLPLFYGNPLAGVANQSLWTLKYEVLCYALLAVVGGGLLRYRAKAALAAATIGVWGAVMILFPPALGDGNTALQNTHYFFLFFSVGVVAYLARSILPVSVYGVAVLFLLSVLTLDSRWTTVAMALFLGYGSIYAASVDIGPLRHLANRYDLSYGTYIYAFPVTQTLLATYPTLDAGPLIVLATAVVLPLALLSWILVERPGLALRPRLVARFGDRRTSAKTA